jgi:hypothetical protein
MRILAVLVLINFINFADRLVVLPLLGQLRDTFQLTSVRLAAALQTVLPVAGRFCATSPDSRLYGLVKVYQNKLRHFSCRTAARSRWSGAWT